MGIPRLFGMKISHILIFILFLSSFSLSKAASADVTFSFDEKTSSYSPVRGRIVITNGAYENRYFTAADVTGFSFSVSGLGTLDSSNATLNTLVQISLDPSGKEIIGGIITIARLDNPKLQTKYATHAGLWFNQHAKVHDEWSMNWRKYVENDLGELLPTGGTVGRFEGDWFRTGKDPCKSIEAIEGRVINIPSPLGMQAVLSPLFGCKLSEIAANLGGTHFNWLSKLIDDTEANDPNFIYPEFYNDINGNPPPKDRPFTDPPRGGFKYLESAEHCNTIINGDFGPTNPSADEYDWYWNDYEFCVPKGLDYTDYVTNDFELRFNDTPYGMSVGHWFDFITSLVLVDAENNHRAVHVYSRPGLSFRWKAVCNSPSVGNKCSSIEDPESRVYSNPIPVIGTGATIEFSGFIDPKSLPEEYRSSLEEDGIQIHGSQFSELDSPFGPKSLTLDHQTGKKWLDLVHTTNRSYDEISAEMGQNGEFEGYRYASTDEVQELFSNAGFNGGTWSELNYDAFNLLVSFIGISFEIPGFSVMEGMTGTTIGTPPDLRTPLVTAFRDEIPGRSTFMRGSITSGNSTFPSNDKSTEFGHWLVALDEVLPVANAGTYQEVLVKGSSVFLDGSLSSGNNLPLLYQWSFVSTPAGSSATLVNADSVNASFTVDFPGVYDVQLIVTDSMGISSLPNTITVELKNIQPVADAGPDQDSYVGHTIMLNGTASGDPDFDPITYNWTFSSVPAGSTATLIGANSASPTFTPDLPDIFVVQLIVNDGYADSTPDEVNLAVSTGESFAEQNSIAAINAISVMPLDSFIKKGNQKELINNLEKATKALQDGKYEKASKALEKVLEHVDGCAFRGSPDDKKTPEVDGKRPKKDHISNCIDQAMIYPLLMHAFNALTL